MDTNKIGTFISSVRKEKGLTQKQLANKIGVTDKAISKWETGKGLPELSCLKLLCDVLDISIIEFLNGKYNKQKEDEENVLKMMDYSKLDMIKKEKRYKIQLLLAIGLCIIILFSTIFYRFYQNDEGVIKNKMLNYVDTNFGTRSNYDLESEKLDVAVLTEQMKQEGTGICVGTIYFDETGTYYSLKLKKKDTLDETFTVVYCNGTIYDDYDCRVTGKENLTDRLIEEYEKDIRSTIDKALLSTNDLFVSSVAYHNIEYNNSFLNNMKYTRKIDQELDISLTYIIDCPASSDINYQDITDQLLAFKENLEKNNFHIYDYSLIIQDNKHNQEYVFENITREIINGDLKRELLSAKKGVHNRIQYSTSHM